MERFSTQIFRKSMAVVFALLFWWANYGINYTTLHHHENEHHHTHKNTHSEKDNCQICDFQALVYEPLQQSFSEIDFYHSTEIFSEPFHKVISFNTHTHETQSQRGPPYFNFI